MPSRQILSPFPGVAYEWNYLSCGPTISTKKILSRIKQLPSIQQKSSIKYIAKDNASNLACWYSGVNLNPYNGETVACCQDAAHNCRYKSTSTSSLFQTPITI